MYGSRSIVEERAVMTIYLDEDEVGADAQTIGYPHLLLCMGVTVVMADGTLIGAHVSSRTTENLVLAQLLADVNANGGAMAQLYCFADVGDHCGRHGCMDIAGKAGALGFHGSGYVFDFGYAQFDDGAYVEITSTGAATRASVRFKRNDKVVYDVSGPGPNVTKADQDFYGRPRTIVKTSAKIGVTGKSKKMLGQIYGHHQIKTAPANALTAHAL
jgi:hypothetical protein